MLRRRSFSFVCGFALLWIAAGCGGDETAAAVESAAGESAVEEEGGESSAEEGSEEATGEESAPSREEEGGESGDESGADEDATSDEGGETGEESSGEEGAEPECSEDGDCSADGVGACLVPACEDGVCSTAPLADGTACELTEEPDTDLCITGSACKAGECVAEVVDCDDQDPCTNDVCSPYGGECIYTAVTSAECVGDTPCDDENPCPQGQYCDEGTCTLQKLEGEPCGDSSECLDGFCNEADCVVQPKKHARMTATATMGIPAPLRRVVRTENALRLQLWRMEPSAAPGPFVRMPSVWSASTMRDAKMGMSAR